MTDDDDALWKPEIDIKVCRFFVACI